MEYLKEFALKALGLLKSRKFWAAIGASLVVVAAEGFAASSAAKLAAIWIAYIFGVAIEDGLRGNV